MCGAACRLDQPGCERALMLSMCCAKACRTRTMSQPASGRWGGPNIGGDTGAVTSCVSGGSSYAAVIRHRAALSQAYQ